MRAWRGIRRHPSAVLLVVQLLALLAYPIPVHEAASRSIVGLIGVIVLGLAVNAVRGTPALTGIALVLGVPLVVLIVWEGIDPQNVTVTLISAVLHTIFYFYTGYALIRYMFGDDVVTSDEWFATGATFTVVAWGFAYVYTAAQVIWPHSFIAAQHPDQPRTWMELLFLSVTTLTSTGLSDVVPVQPYARSLVMIEEIAGMLYLALVVARVTSLTTSRVTRRRDAPADQDASAQE